MPAWYNDSDPYCAGWLRNLIDAGLIADGDVDGRDIRDVSAGEIAGYDQCHFFAGIGGWSYALRLAGWPDDRPVWTGSCPCQPLSGAGKRQGHADERHLWPAFYHLIAECRPATVFGERVAGPLGREWLAGVRADLEDIGYAVGAADLCAAGVGAPHIRQRLFWVAVAEGVGSPPWARQHGGEHGALQSERRGASDGLGDAPSARPQGQWREHRAGGEGQGQQPGPAMQDGVPQWNGPTVVTARADGSVRIPAEPALFPVAPRVSGDVGRLRGAGNSIVPQVAAAFVASVLELLP